MKTIGLIGGMSWESTVSYYQIINEEVKRRLGGLHSAKVILYSVEFDEIEKCQSDGDWKKSGDIMDLIANDIRKTARDAYIGKLSNSYDNKVLLITAIHGYFDGLINDGLVEKNTVTVDIDMEEQKKYLKSNGVNISTMSDQQLNAAKRETNLRIK